jgi:hypothetical protein
VRQEHLGKSSLIARMAHFRPGLKLRLKST